MHIYHLHRRELLQNSTRCQPRCQCPGAVFECDLQAVSDERDEDVRLDSRIGLMMYRSYRQIVFQFLERLLDFGQQDVVLPDQSRLESRAQDS